MGGVIVGSERFFDVAAEGYDRLMGRYLPSLGPRFADAARGFGSPSAPA